MVLTEILVKVVARTVNRHFDLGILKSFALKGRPEVDPKSKFGQNRSVLERTIILGVKRTKSWSQQRPKPSQVVHWVRNGHIFILYYGAGQVG